MSPGHNEPDKPALTFGQVLATEKWHYITLCCLFLTVSIYSWSQGSNLWVAFAAPKGVLASSLLRLWQKVVSGRNGPVPLRPLPGAFIGLVAVVIISVLACIVFMAL